MPSLVKLGEPNGNLKKTMVTRWSAEGEGRGNHYIPSENPSAFLGGMSTGANNKLLML